MSCRRHSLGLRTPVKLFQHLLVAPAALGLFATGVNAADLSINSISDYSETEEQVTSITQFSTITKLKGKTVLVAGATHAKGDNFNTRGEKGARDAYNAEYGAFSFSYDLRLGLKTSFTGKDLLPTPTTRLCW